MLSKLLPPLADELQLYIDALQHQQTDRSLVLANIHDFLVRHDAVELTRALQSVNPFDLPPFEANYLAAMIETACKDKQIPIPKWMSRIEPLQSPWFASELKNLRLHLLTSSPPAFRCRNLFVDSTLGARV